MDRVLRRRINEEVETYRKALVYYARACEWERFKSKAGGLFDYLETVELTVLEKKFFRIFRTILAALIVAAAVILKLDSGLFPALLPYKTQITMAALGVSCFELYFYVDFRWYVDLKRSRYTARRERFIRNIEDDFRVYAVRSQS